MPSLREIAKHAGVSPATASRVLNDHPSVSREARQSVLDAAHELGYVARVGKRSTSNIALLFTDEMTVGSPYDAALLQGMAFGMESYGFDLIVLNARNARRADEDFPRMLIRKGVRGVVIRATDRTHGICEEIAASGFPAVVVGTHPEGGTLQYIYSDSRPGSREAVEHLLGLGHRRIAIALNIVDDSDHLDRHRGYLDAHEAAGLDPDPELLVRVPARRDGGETLIKRLLGLPDPPTALFVSDPLVAVGAVAACRRMGLDIPGDLSVIGFDDADLRHAMHPRLSAVCQDAVALGRDAFARLNGLLDGKRRGPDAATLGTATSPAASWLELHETVGPPPATPPVIHPAEPPRLRV